MIARVLRHSAVLALVALLGLPTITQAIVGWPVDLTVSGGTYTSDTTPTFTWEPAGGATWYDYKIDSGSYVGIGNVFSYTASSLSEGWHTFYLRGHNNDGEIGEVRSVTFEIDTAGPVVPTVSPSTATEDESVTFTVTPSGEASVTSCTLYVGGASVGSMSKSGSTFSKSYTFTNDGSYTVYAQCTDGDGNTTTGSSRMVTVYEDDSDDNGPTVPAVSPSSATEDESETFTVYPDDEETSVSSCTLYVNGANAGTMYESSSGSYYYKSYTFSTDGSYTVYAKCTDTEGNTTTGTSRTVTVYEDDEPVDDEPNDTNAEEGDLIKIECEGDVDVNDPCTSVYYWGTDGKRHPFPNESVFYTWYDGFGDVVEIDADDMADIPMGETVTYKPGTVVVKFDSSDYVYAIEEGAVLRHYLTPELVAADYGSNWATEDLVTSSDIFFSDYFIGTPIDSASDYDPDDEEDGVTSIDDNF